MKRPNPVEIAMVAAPLITANRSVRDAVELARELIEEASRPPIKRPMPLGSKEAAKDMGYVTRNWRNQLKNLCVKQWERIAARLSSSWRDANGETFFAHYDEHGWDSHTIKQVKDAKQAALTESRKRPKPRQIKSRAK